MRSDIADLKQADDLRQAARARSAITLRGRRLPAVRGIWVSQGMPESQAHHGALGGALGGGVLIAMLTGFRRYDHSRITIGAGLGALVGTILGSAVRREPWRRIR